MEEILGIFGIDWRLLLVQAVNFGLLLGVLWYFLYRPLLRMLTLRQEKIEKGVRDAEVAQQKIIEIEAAKDATMLEATRKAEEVIHQAKERAKEKEGELVKEAQEKGGRIITEAEKRGEELKRKALLESQTEIARLAVLGAEKILRK